MNEAQTHDVGSEVDLTEDEFINRLVAEGTCCLDVKLHLREHECFAQSCLGKGDFAKFEKYNLVWMSRTDPSVDGFKHPVKIIEGALTR